MRKRSIQIVIVSFALVILLALLYLLKINGVIALNCVTYTHFGILCPGCGITRMVSSILKADFIKAFRYNQLVFIMIPYMIYTYTYGCMQYIKYGIVGDKAANKILRVVVILTIWGIVRNIPGLEMLSPNTL